ncbi:DUF427 domain-containing protein [Kribbella turkmenica]|uniref:DUF427 domain-containing protein n=1 Tax=Kribbella turkmenica TaxID=2530375 RepID=A0A4R4WPI2_9ACTN|nr:DUF427 domain-containing protein [Kribbella turkmenica]
MKAVVGETVVAEAGSDAVVGIEGNDYFPPDSVAAGVLRTSATPYCCQWQGMLARWILSGCRRGSWLPLLGRA